MDPPPPHASFLSIKIRLDSTHKKNDVLRVISSCNLCNSNCNSNC